MARKILRGSFSLLFCLSILFLQLFAVCDFCYPNHISCRTGDEIPASLLFSYQKEEAVETFSGGASFRTERGKVALFGLFPIKEVAVSYYDKTSLIPGGELFGIRMETKGLFVSAIGKVETETGARCPGADAGLEAGDLLLRADGVELKSTADLLKLFTKSAGKSLEIEYEREGSVKKTFLSPAKSTDQSYKAGLWVREGASGIGTITFIDPVDSSFAGLGHGICDTESGVLFPLGSGEVAPAIPEGVVKGKSGIPGEICGSLGKDHVGALLKNRKTGVYGTLSKNFAHDSAALPIALKNEVQTGKASILCTLDATGKQEYEIEIQEIIDKESKTKNMILHVTDPALLEKTGGIVQGMSGSPILQNGKIVGAVTHVLVQDPTRGYGIFIENMLSQ